MSLDGDKLNLERRNIIKENMNNFKKYIHSTKEIEKLKILGYGDTFDKDKGNIWFIHTKKMPDSPELPKEYLGIQIEYSQIIKSSFL